MKRTILTLIFTVGTLPVGFAQTQTQSTTEKTQEHSATTVNPDGTAVHSTAKEHEKTDTVNANGSSRTTKAKQSRRKTQVKTDDGVDKTTTTEHHAASSTDTTKTTTTPPNF